MGQQEEEEEEEVEEKASEDLFLTLHKVVDILFVVQWQSPVVRTFPMTYRPWNTGLLDFWEMTYSVSCAPLVSSSHSFTVCLARGIQENGLSGR